jgi:hypothetical protein
MIQNLRVALCIMSVPPFVLMLVPRSPIGFGRLIEATSNSARRRPAGLGPGTRTRTQVTSVAFHLSETDWTRLCDSTSALSGPIIFPPGDDGIYQVDPAQFVVVNDPASCNGALMALRVSPSLRRGQDRRLSCAPFLACGIFPSLPDCSRRIRSLLPQSEHQCRFAPTADRDHPGIVTAFFSESAITFNGIPTSKFSDLGLCRSSSSS